MKIKRLLINWLTKHLLIAVTPSEVISILQNEKGQLVRITLGTDKITQDELKTLKSEAVFITKTRLWSVLTNTLAEQAKLRMFEKSKCDADMIFGKASLLNIETQKNIVNTILKTQL